MTITKKSAFSRAVEPGSSSRLTTGIVS